MNDDKKLKEKLKAEIATLDHRIEAINRPINEAEITERDREDLNAALRDLASLGGYVPPSPDNAPKTKQ